MCGWIANPTPLVVGLSRYFVLSRLLSLLSRSPLHLTHHVSSRHTLPTNVTTWYCDEWQGTA